MDALSRLFVVAVSITFQTPSCAGTLVAPRWAVTAAHCINAGFGMTIAVWGGDSGSRSDHSCGELISVDPLCYPGYVSRTLEGDLCLLRLQTDMRCPWTADLKYPVLSEVLSGTTHAYVAGWGDGSYGVLSEARIQILSRRDCATRWGAHYVADTMVCGGIIADSCFGDSGGPLYTYEGHRSTPQNITFIGITSFGGATCNDSARPGVYTRLSAYLPWVHEYIDANELYACRCVTECATNGAPDGDWCYVASFACLHASSSDVYRGVAWRACRSPPRAPPSLPPPPPDDPATMTIALLLPMLTSAALNTITLCSSLIVAVNTSDATCLVADWWQLQADLPDGVSADDYLNALRRTVCAHVDGEYCVVAHVEDTRRSLVAHARSASYRVVLGGTPRDQGPPVVNVTSFAVALQVDTTDLVAPRYSYRGIVATLRFTVADRAIAQIEVGSLVPDGISSMMQSTFNLTDVRVEYRTETSEHPLPPRSPRPPSQVVPSHAPDSPLRTPSVPHYTPNAAPDSPAHLSTGHTRPPSYAPDSPPHTPSVSHYTPSAAPDSPAHLSTGHTRPPSALIVPRAAVAQDIRSSVSAGLVAMLIVAATILVLSYAVGIEIYMRQRYARLMQQRLRGAFAQGTTRRTVQTGQQPRRP